MIAEPIPVAEPAFFDPILAVQPGIPVVLPTAPSEAPNSTAATCATGWPDNAPPTARQDALLRDWPYPPGALPPGDVTQAPGKNALLAGAGTAANDAAIQERKDPLAGWGPPPAPLLDPRRFAEAHWQGMEVIPNTPLLAQALKIRADVQGVIIDDASLPADLQGFVAGDVVTHVDRVPTPDLTSFIEAADRVRDQPQAELWILRDGQMQSAQLTALKERLGTANGETAGMILPGARMPHQYRGPCTNCHRIGTTGTLPVDQGDLMITTAPVIQADARRPHRDRGPCRACHQILP